MRFLKKLVGAIFWLLILALLIAPIGLIHMIAQEEMAEYAPPDPPQIVDVSLGKPVEAETRDIAQNIMVTGTFVSGSYAYMELDYKKPGEIRWLKTVGEEIQEGELLGYYMDDPIYSGLTGIIEEINVYSADPYLRVSLFSPIILECNLDKSDIRTLEKAPDSLITEYDEPVHLAYIAQRKNPDGSALVRLSIDSDYYRYGEVVEDLLIYTGVVYEDVVVLPESCVYSKTENGEEQFYVRRVTADGIFMEEMRVSVLFENATYLCVSGVKDGQFFDSGYKAVAEENRP
ncbi:MAG: hypothetical protein E7459_06140 [Ruminococcaceae bacterium]|nr:hypothetical protein [Oscillospiraceae bacterium]